MSKLPELAIAYMKNPCNDTYRGLHKPLLNYISSVLAYHRIQDHSAEHYQGLVVQYMLEHPFHKKGKGKILNCIHTIIKGKWVNEVKREVNRREKESEYCKRTEDFTPLQYGLYDQFLDDNGEVDLDAIQKFKDGS